MRITFLEPGASPTPLGRTRITYEYANRLSRRGHEVTVVHPVAMTAPPVLWRRIKARWRHLRWGWNGRWRPDRWFPVDPAVRTLWVPELSARHIPDADAMIATTWRPAEVLAGFDWARARKYYMVHHVEYDGGPVDRVIGAWSLPLGKIVINRTLVEFGAALGQLTALVPNGLDFAQFDQDVPLEHRPPARIAMLYSRNPTKRSLDGLEALRRARAEIPELSVDLFGPAEAPADLPDWVRHHRLIPNPELRALYNGASVFVSASAIEGWGLPPCEALMCGCALAITDIDGHREYAEPERTALLSPPSDPAALAVNIVRLIRDPDLRRQLAAAGRERLRQFSWERSLDAMEAALTT